MRTPLSIATKGRITTVAKTALTIATIGWLVVSSPVSPNPSSTGAGLQETSTHHEQISRYKKLQERRIRDEWDWVAAIQCFLKINNNL